MCGKSNSNNEINLTENDLDYIYDGTNYTMIIEPIYDEEEYTLDAKYNVTIINNNREKKSSKVYLPGLDEYYGTLQTFSNGYIQFENEDQTKRGWYDENGNQITVSSKYSIRDIKDNKVILQENTDESDGERQELNFVILDMSGKVLLRTSALDVYDDVYLIKNENKKMVLMDRGLNVISYEYDKIITTVEVDITSNYSSYY